MASNLYHSAKFITSCAEIEQLPPALGPEVAFAGRSNAGKSSTLNKLCEQTGLAHVSKTPGRTQMLNFFGLSNDAYLVDLPGYGFAKAPKNQRRRWGQLIEHYLLERTALSGLIVIMDIRRPLTEHDVQMLVWCEHRGLPAHVLLNKCDKLKQGEIARTFNRVKQALGEYEAEFSCQTFSASKGSGMGQLKGRLDDWLRPDDVAAGANLT